MYGMNSIRAMNQRAAALARADAERRRVEAEATAAANARYAEEEKVSSTAAPEQVTEAEIKLLDALFNEYEADLLKPQAA